MAHALVLPESCTWGLGRPAISISRHVKRTPQPSAAYFAAALEALDYEPGQTWMVGDDVEADIGGATAFGLRSVLVRTGKFREQTLTSSLVKPDAVVDSLSDVPGYLADAS